MGGSFQFTRASDMEVDDRILIWGPSGTGKTACAVRGAKDLDLDLREVVAGRAVAVGDPTVFALATEKNALRTIRLVNPQAGARLCESKKAAIEVIRAAQSGELRAAGFTRLVVDGLTEIQRLIADLLKRDDAYWGDLITESRTMLRTLRSIPMTVVATALEARKEDEDTKEVRVMPQFEGRTMADSAVETYAASGYCRKVGEGDDLRYVVDFSESSRYRVKECGPLTGRVKPCAGAWLDVLAGTLPYDAIRLARNPAPAERAPQEQAAAEEAAPASRSVAR